MFRLLLCVISLSALACASQPSGSGASSPRPGLKNSHDIFGWFALEQSFRVAQDDFTRSLQEGRLDDAVAFVEPPMREAFRGLKNDLDEAQLTQFEIEDVHVARLTGEASALVRFRGPGSGAPLEITQHWRLDRNRNRWYIRPEIDRLRGVAMAARPGLVGPAALAK